MSEFVPEDFAKALGIIAKRAEELKKQIDIDSVEKALSQCAQMFVTLDNIKISDSLADTLSMLGQSMQPISELQKIAISKAFDPSNLSLNEDQIRIRSSITKAEAEVLSESSTIDVRQDKFTYKSEEISRSKVKEAIQAVQLFDDVTLDEIMDFSSFLHKYPYLSTTTEVGKKILEECSTIEERYLTELSMETDFFRARVMKEEDEPFSEQEMRRAPFKIPGQGRFNTQGVARFYLSGNMEDAANEVKKHAKEATKIQIAKYRATTSVRLLNLKKINNAWSKKCLKSVPNPGPFNVEYLCSGYLAQCLDYYKEIDGIMYGEEGHYLYMLFEDRKFKDNGMMYLNI